MERRSDLLFRSHIGRDIADHAETSSQRHNWYVNETDLFETPLRRFIGMYVDHRICDAVATYNCYISETDQLNTSQRRHNWYLNETNVFETLQRRTNWYFKETGQPEIPQKRTM